MPAIITLESACEVLPNSRLRFVQICLWRDRRKESASVYGRDRLQFHKLTGLRMPKGRAKMQNRDIDGIFRRSSFLASVQTVSARNLHIFLFSPSLNCFEFAFVTKLPQS